MEMEPLIRWRRSSPNRSDRLVGAWLLAAVVTYHHSVLLLQSLHRAMPWWLESGGVLLNDGVAKTGERRSHPLSVAIFQAP